MINSKEMIAYKKRIDFLENELAEAKLKILDLEQQLISSLGSTCKASPSYTDSYSQYDSFDIVRETPVIEVLTAEALAEVAESSIAQSSYVYDPDMKMYYDKHSKCYYDAEKSLYYEPSSGVYYSYNEESQNYEFHSQINMQDFNIISHILKNKSSHSNLPEPVIKKDVKRGNKVKKFDGSSSKCNDEAGLQKSEIEEGEILSNDDDDDDDDFNDDDDDHDYNGDKVSDKSDNTRSIAADEMDLRSMPETYMSCIRAVVKSSNCLQINSLVVLTCKGASIGRDESLKHDVVISDLKISRMHCSIKYDERLREYFVTDEGSVSGTFVNDKRIGENKEVGASHRLQHLDLLRIGDSTTFELHIHPCSDTCCGCEPWNLKVLCDDEDDRNESTKQMSTDQQRRFQLKMIKKKYGLKNMNYEKQPKLSASYRDRAKKRRAKVGSDCSFIVAQPASIDRALPESNIGHKMLKKMGWKSGQSLGRSQTGLLEPITAEIRVDEKAGMGTSTRVNLDDVGKISKLKALMITKNRYENSIPVADECLSCTDCDS